jgi:hypothetical protein
MPVHTIDLEEKERLTGQAANQFKARHPEYWPCQANSDKLIGFIESQLGCPIVDYPYPLQLENFEVAYEHIKATSWFYTCPEEPKVEDPAVIRDQAALEAANANLAACRAEEIRIAKKMPLKELGTFTSVENAKLREARDQNLLPDRPVGQSSRPLSTVTLGMKATARANVALANPPLDRNSSEFAKLYAAELSGLRG